MLVLIRQVTHEKDNMMKRNWWKRGCFSEEFEMKWSRSQSDVTFYEQLDRVGPNVFVTRKRKINVLPRAQAWFMMPVTFVGFLLRFIYFSLIHPHSTWSFVPGFLCDSHSFPKNIHKLPPDLLNSCKIPFSTRLETRIAGCLPMQFYVMCGWELSPSWGWGEKDSYIRWHGHLFWVWGSH